MSVRFLLILSLPLFISCNKSETEEFGGDFGYEYFPLTPGAEYIYEVDSIIFRETAAGIRRDSSRSQLREIVVDSLEDNTGQTVYRIERYTRPGPEDPWRVHSVVSASRDRRQAVRTEDNLRFIKLVFPVRAGRQWDGNIHLPDGLTQLLGTREIELFKGWDYQIVSAGEPAQAGDLSFPDVATVSLADFESAIEYRYVTEQYAKGVGLVSREMILLDTQCRACCNGDIGAACQGLEWGEKAESGLILRMRLLNY